MTLLMFGDSARSMDMFHALGATIIDPFLYVDDGDRRVAVIGHIDHETIRESAPEIELLDTMRFGRRELFEQGYDWTGAQLEVSRRALRELGITAATVSWDFPTALADLLRADGIELTVDHRAFEARRRVKTPVQLAGIRRAQAAADASMARAAELLRECRNGLTAETLRSEMQQVSEARGCDLDDDVIVAVNAQAANGHDSGSGPIARGDNVLIDIWPRDQRSRCWADMTRTFVAGGEQPPEELVQYWELAKTALDRVLPEVRPGIHGRELHGIASQVFEDAGQPTLRTAPADQLPDHGFLHSLGHGVGLEIHESPGLGLAGDPLVAGDVIAIEPGCYRQGFGGVRLEDLVLVTDDGGETLTQFPYGLTP